MTMNFQTVHYAMIVCSAVAASLPNLEHQFPAKAGPTLHALTAVFALLTAVLGALSGSVKAAKVEEPKEPEAKP